MNSHDSDIRVLCLLSIQRALLGKVFGKMRRAGIRVNGAEIEIRWVVAGQLTDDEESLLGEVETELLSDLPDEFRVTASVSGSTELPADFTLFFMRYEANDNK